jgi:metal-dependent amidase/aminoacylase/carboxypeptidase family protein
MDALPIPEVSERDYCSTNCGVMHACGHDGTCYLGLCATHARRD